MNDYMLTNTDRVSLLEQIAEMYYERQMSQQDIADELCFSRSAISRFLNKARELNIVTIRVSRPTAMTHRNSRGRDRVYMLVQVAEMYYLQQMSQQDIANVLGFSRSAISRFLNEANEMNIVHICVNHAGTRGRNS